MDGLERLRVGSTRVRFARWGVVALLACSVGVAGIDERAWILTGAEAFLRNVYVKIFGEQIFNLLFWVGLGGSLLLQRLLPASRQPMMSKGLLQDLMWFLYEPFFSVFVYGIYVLWAKELYTQHLSFLTINALLSQPPWLRFVLAIVIKDFLNWFQHLLHHKIPFLWNLHCLHHSQRELNFFSSYRFHPVEFFFRHTVMVFPFFVLDLSPPTIIAFILFESWYVRFYHANIRTNLGLLRYLVVTPQSHRIHHSVEPRHFDMNFGALLSIWDRIFGTHYAGYDEYPRTGIDDAEFPLEQSQPTTVRALLLTPFSQMVYCLQKNARLLSPTPADLPPRKKLR